MRLLAHAKVNMSLEVGAVRPDGFHPYVSIATSIGVADSLTVLPAAAGDGPKVSTSTSTGLVDTLATRAAELVLAAGDGGSAVTIAIDKAIPAGAGLAGGSADAAAALVGVCGVAGVKADIVSMAVELGTDVPFCLIGGHARLYGRGELVESRAPLPPFGILVVVPPVHVSTVDVFERFDEVGPGGPSSIPPQWLRSLVPDCSFRNDLEASALVAAPELERWKARIEAVAESACFMTGSGAGFVVYARTEAELEAPAQRLRLAGAAVFVATPAAAGVEVVDIC